MKQTVVLILLCFLSVASTRADEYIYNPLSVGLRWKMSPRPHDPDGRVIHGTAIREITGTEVIGDKAYFKSVTRFRDIPGLTEFTNTRLAL